MRTAATVANGQVLQLALTTLVTDRAIQRVVNEQKLHHGLLCLDGFISLGVNHHALRYGRGTRGHRFGCLFNVHQAHTAVGRDREFLVVAKMRDVGAGFFGGMHHHTPLGNLNLFAV